tara:strand:- start:65 stop:571 length:507 start_codon:yes stop_codon:yes gene_type:complete
MSDEFLEIVDNIKQPSVWVRVLFMIVFGVASYLLLIPLIIILSIAQVAFALITGEVNANLKYFSASLDLYVSQIVRFLTSLSEEKPFPFSDFPQVEDSSLTEAPAADVAMAAGNSPSGEEKPKPASKRKTAAKKASAKKVVKKKSAKKAVTEKTASAQKSIDEDPGNI